MPAFVIENRAQLWRWSVSVALALVLHAAAAVALLNWGKTIASLSLSSLPVINIDLTPLAAAPGLLQGELPRVAAPAPSRTEVAPTLPAERAPLQTGENKNATGAGSSTEPTAPPAPAVAPGTAGPSTQTGAGNNQEGGAVGGGSVPRAEPNDGHGGAANMSPLPKSEMDSMPLDTRITVMPELYAKKPDGGIAQRKKQTVIFRPSKHPGQVAQPEHTHNLNTSSGPLIRTNAVGAHVQDRVRAALARAGSRGETRNAIGGAAAPGIARGDAGSANATSVTKNAIGLTVPIRPGIPATNAGEPKTAAVAPGAAGSVTNRAVVSGHEMIRPGVSTGVIGGPAKSSVGGLNGTNFHVRHP